MIYVNRVSIISIGPVAILVDGKTVKLTELPESERWRVDCVDVKWREWELPKPPLTGGDALPEANA